MFSNSSNFQDHENNGEVAPPAPASGPASTKHQAIEKSETVSKATGANTAQGVSKSDYVIIQYFSILFLFVKNTASWFFNPLEKICKDQISLTNKIASFV